MLLGKGLTSFFAQPSFHSHAFQYLQPTLHRQESLKRFSLGFRISGRFKVFGAGQQRRFI